MTIAVYYIGDVLKHVETCWKQPAQRRGSTMARAWAGECCVHPTHEVVNNSYENDIKRSYRNAMPVNPQRSPWMHILVELGDAGNIPINYLAATWMCLFSAWGTKKDTNPLQCAVRNLQPASACYTVPFKFTRAKTTRETGMMGQDLFEIEIENTEWR